jgi:SH3-like domain-containing protein
VGDSLRTRCSLRTAGALALAALALVACKKGDQDPSGGRKTPSGLPVPRYVTLKFNEVNARGGPGDDYRLLWVYRAKGLPLQVVEETREWRRVCDPNGKLAWVKGTGVDGRRKVLSLLGEPVTLRARPQTTARVEAYLAPHALADLDRCKAGWCKLKVRGLGGWAPASAFWGTDERRQCR